MNTQTLDQFEVLSTDVLESVDGGVSTPCVGAVVVGALWGGGRGLAGGPLAGAVGTAIGAAAGAILACR